MTWLPYDFWEAARSVSGQPGLGVRLAERTRPSDFGLLGELIQNSATLSEALLHGVRLSRLALRTAQFVVHADSEHTCVSLVALARSRLHPEEVDFILSAGVLAARALTGEDVSPVEVSFAHAMPSDASHHRRVFRAPLRFGAAQTACTFATRALLATLPRGDARLRSSLVDEAERRMMEGMADFSLQLRAAILAELRHGDPSIERVASRLNTHPRKITRTLRAAGLSYRALLARTRFELAEQELRCPSARVTAIADALGYSDKSAFIRAFKRHAGCAPLEYRERLRRALLEQETAKAL